MVLATASNGLHNIEGLTQLAELGLALVLSAAVGLEREVRQKSAGLRTHSLVGLGAALFMLVSKYGFYDVVIPREIVADPSRVAAQIVSGVGFLGAGLIFVRRDAVRGLTTAAAIWVTAAIGACAGAGLPILALATTAAYFVIVLLFPVLTRKLPSSPWAISTLHVRYLDGRGLLRDIMREVTARGFSVAEVSTDSYQAGEEGDGHAAGQVELILQIYGRGSVNELATHLGEMSGVSAVRAADINSGGE